MSIRKSVNKFMSVPAEMRISDVILVLAYFGFEHARTNGSHYIFDNLKNDTIVIPVHKKKVTRIYLKYAKSVITKS